MRKFPSLHARSFLTPRIVSYLVLLSMAACVMEMEEGEPPETENVGTAQERIVTDNSVKNTPLNYAAGAVLDNGVMLSNGFNLGNGGSGGGIPNGIDVANGVIQPADGSDLD